MKKDYRELYEKITKSDWFKKAYHNKSLGECPIVVEELEDERMRERVIESLVCYRGKVYDEGKMSLLSLVDEEIDWLRKQKEQKPAEWSEETQKDIDAAAEYLRIYANNFVQGGNSKRYVLDLADRIESLTPKSKQEWSEEDEKQNKYIDLGLPSGTKWASCNVGANAPEEYGEYYSLDKALNLNVKVPSKEQWDELRTKCTWTWITRDGINGKLVIGPNGNSIFLPAAGYRYDTGLCGAGSVGYYWSSSLYSGYPYRAWGVNFDSDDVFKDYDYSHLYWFSVRVVSK